MQSPSRRIPVLLAIGWLIAAAGFAAAGFVAVAGPVDELQAAFPQFGFPESSPREGDNAWRSIDRAAERVFHDADKNHDDLLSDAEARHALRALERTMGELVAAGAVRSIPPMALNGQAFGLKLPGQEQTSQPEFVLFARSMALRMANPPPPMPMPPIQNGAMRRRGSRPRG